MSHSVDTASQHAMLTSNDNMYLKELDEWQTLHDEDEELGSYMRIRGWRLYTRKLKVIWFVTCLIFCSILGMNWQC